MLSTLFLSALLTGPVVEPPPVARLDDVTGEVVESPIVTRVREAVGEKMVGKPFLLVVSVTVKEGEEKAFIAAYRGAAAKSLAEEGCTSYALSRDAETKNKFLLYERWKSLEALSV
ncbi:MAG: antibiotic biosynthesis monooxygenase family protein, partial [Planctomycetota bacterium]